MTFFSFVRFAALCVALPLLVWIGQKIVRRMLDAFLRKHIVVFVDPAEDAGGPQWASERVLGTRESWFQVPDALFGLYLFGKLFNNIGTLSPWCRTHVHVVVPSSSSADSLVDGAVVATSIHHAISGQQTTTTTVYFVQDGSGFSHAATVRIFDFQNDGTRKEEENVELRNILALRDRIPPTIDFLILYSGKHITSDILASFASSRRVKNTLVFTDADTGRYGFDSEEEFEVAAEQDALRHMEHPADKSFTLQMSLNTYAFCPGPSNQLWFPFSTLDPPTSAVQIASRGFENCRQWMPALMYRECYDVCAEDCWLNNHDDEIEQLDQLQQHADTVVSKSAAFFVYAATLWTWQKNSFWNIGTMFTPGPAENDDNALLLVEDAPLHTFVDGSFRARRLRTSTRARPAWAVHLTPMGAPLLREHLLPLVHSATEAEEAAEADLWDTDSD